MAGKKVELGFDEVMEQLRGVVGRLEQGNLGLEESLADYEKGVGFARRGHQLLDAAEKRVEILVHGPEGQSARPFEPIAEEQPEAEA